MIYINNNHYLAFIPDRDAPRHKDGLMYNQLQVYLQAGSRLSNLLSRAATLGRNEANKLAQAAKAARPASTNARPKPVAPLPAQAVAAIAGGLSSKPALRSAAGIDNDELHHINFN